MNPSRAAVDRRLDRRLPLQRDDPSARSVLAEPDLTEPAGLGVAPAGLQAHDGAAAACGRLMRKPTIPAPTTILIIILIIVLLGGGGGYYGYNRYGTGGLGGVLGLVVIVLVVLWLMGALGGTAIR
jgi:hypothetical protein